MKNNKKGFTLVEILATIAIMGAIATMVSVNIVGIFDEKNKASEESKNSIIEEAASVYLELDKNKALKENCKINGCNISTTDLINNGLIDEKDIDAQKTIKVYYQNNEKKCEIQEG